MTRTKLKRLVRSLAVEHGDETLAPAGWSLNLEGDTWTNNQSMIVLRRDRWWYVIHKDAVIGHCVYALDAMEWADLAYIGLDPGMLNLPTPADT